MSKRVAIATALAVAAMFAAAAFGYAATYVSTVAWGPGSEDHSGFTTGLKGNVVQFDNRYGGTPYMGTNYVDTGGSYYMTWNFENDGYILDNRNEFNYAAAACRASGGNAYTVYVSSCYTNN
jgi:hypothetical protein